MITRYRYGVTFTELLIFIVILLILAVTCFYTIATFNESGDWQLFWNILAVFVIVIWCWCIALYHLKSNKWPAMLLSLMCGVLIGITIMRYFAVVGW